MDEEAEPQVVAGHAGEVVGQAPARPQPGAELADDPAPSRSWPMNVTQPRRRRPRASPACRGRGRGRRSAARRPWSARRRAARRAAPRPSAAAVAHVALQIALDLEQPRQHLHACARTRRGGGLGSARRREAPRARAARPASPRARPGAPAPLTGSAPVTIRRSSANCRSPAGSAGSRSRRPGELDGLRLHLQPEAAAIRAARRIRSGSSTKLRAETARSSPAPGRRARHAGPAGSRAGSASGTAIAFDREVAQGEVRLDRVAAQPGDVDVPGSLAAAGRASSRTPRRA